MYFLNYGASVCRGSDLTGVVQSRASGGSRFPARLCSISLGDDRVGGRRFALLELRGIESPSSGCLRPPKRHLALPVHDAVRAFFPITSSSSPTKEASGSAPDPARRAGSGGRRVDRPTTRSTPPAGPDLGRRRVGHSVLTRRLAPLREPLALRRPLPRRPLRAAWGDASRRPHRRLRVRTGVRFPSARLLSSLRGGPTPPQVGEERPAARNPEPRHRDS